MGYLWFAQASLESFGKIKGVKKVTLSIITMWLHAMTSSILSFIDSNLLKLSLVQPHLQNSVC